MVHGLDQADTDECGGKTAIIEMFPQPNEEKGIRNMNVQVGLLFFRGQRERRLVGPCSRSGQAGQSHTSLAFERRSPIRIIFSTQVGRNYLTWHNEDASRERGDGTDVNLDQVKALVQQAVRGLLSARKC